MPSYALSTSALDILLLLAFILAHLRKTEYGIWAWLRSIQSTPGLLRMGLNSTINLHSKTVHGEASTVNRLVTTAVLSSHASRLANIVRGVVGGGSCGFTLPRSCASQTCVVVLVSSGLVFIVPLTVYAGVLTGLQALRLVVGPRLLSSLRAAAIVAAFSVPSDSIPRGDLGGGQHPDVLPTGTIAYHSSA
jgi:hypothetical protein